MILNTSSIQPGTYCLRSVGSREDVEFQERFDVYGLKSMIAQANQTRGSHNQLSYVYQI